MTAQKCKIQCLGVEEVMFCVQSVNVKVLVGTQKCKIQCLVIEEDMFCVQSVNVNILVGAQKCKIQFVDGNPVEVGICGKTKCKM